MSTITGTVSANTVVTVVAASGDGATVAAMFNSIVFPTISDTAATATNSSGTVTITWPSATCNAGDAYVRQFVTNMLAADTALTSPITITSGQQGYLL